MPLLDTDQMAAGRRFEPSASRNRKTKRGGPRKFQSLWNISQLSDQQLSGIPVTTETTTQAEPTGSTAAAIATNLNKRLPKWLRWGASKKSSAETKMERGPNKVESVLPETLAGEHQGFIGNLGIGGFIETEDSTFVTSDEVDEANVLNTTGTNQTKSLMNLSSLLLWPSQDDTAVGQTSLAPAASPGLGRTQERYSLSNSSRTTSSVEGSPCSWNSTGPNEVLRSRVLSDPRTPSSDQSCLIPELIKVLFLTNTPLGRVLMDVDTLRLTTAEGTRKPLDFVKLIIPLPAWFIHENSPLIPNMTYWVSFYPTKHAILLSRTFREPGIFLFPK
ncbi:hypothetical protein FGIG_10274 [Fasciola gigantica]|uniref:Uncharacterized protein n=1 Tax=Fasciola gigantica TaxID=46835 RepID=A0A504YT75_FASGI|nr:hypothetical protein FGIG_10274 [Fasciola gigantica]